MLSQPWWEHRVQAVQVRVIYLMDVLWFSVRDTSYSGRENRNRLWMKRTQHQRWSNGHIRSLNPQTRLNLHISDTPLWLISTSATAAVIEPSGKSDKICLIKFFRSKQANQTGSFYIYLYIKDEKFHLNYSVAILVWCAKRLSLVWK